MTSIAHNASSSQQFSCVLQTQVLAIVGAIRPNVIVSDDDFMFQAAVTLCLPAIHVSCEEGALLRVLDGFVSKFQPATILNACSSHEKSLEIFAAVSEPIQQMI